MVLVALSQFLTLVPLELVYCVPVPPTPSYHPKKVYPVLVGTESVKLCPYVSCVVVVIVVAVAPTALPPAVGVIVPVIFKYVEPI